MEVELYVCPTPECKNYFGHSGMPDLSGRFTGPKTEDVAALRRATGSGARHSRAQCPDCRSRGVLVERVLVSVHVVKPAGFKEPLPLPN